MTAAVADRPTTPRAADSPFPARTRDPQPDDLDAVLDGLSADALAAALAIPDLLTRATALADGLVPGERALKHWRDMRDLGVMHLLVAGVRKVDVQRAFNGLWRNTIIQLWKRIPAELPPFPGVAPVAPTGDEAADAAAAQQAVIAAVHDVLPDILRATEALPDLLADWRAARDDTIHRIAYQADVQVTNQEVGDLFDIHKVRVTQIRNGPVGPRKRLGTKR